MLTSMYVKTLNLANIIHSPYAIQLDKMLLDKFTVHL